MAALQISSSMLLLLRFQVHKPDVETRGCVRFDSFRVYLQQRRVRKERGIVGDDRVRATLVGRLVLCVTGRKVSWTSRKLRETTQLKET